jgi:hypothetical protein
VVKNMIYFRFLTLILVTLCSSVSFYTCANAGIRSFILYESPSEKLNADGIILKYKLGAAGLQGSVKTDFGDFGGTFGLGYNPKETATMRVGGATAKMEGPVDAVYTALSYKTIPLELGIIEARLFMQHESFAFSGDRLTGALNDARMLSGTVEGKMTNDSIAIQIEVDKLPQDFNLVAEYGQDFWNYELITTAKIVSNGISARLRPKLTSIDPYIKISLRKKILSQELEFYYKQKSLSAASSVTLNRFGINLRFDF